MFVKADDVRVVYMTGTPFETEALAGVSLTIEAREMIGLVGSTGSGKSTLVQALAGLLSPSSGTLAYRDDVDARQLFRTIGLVFQQPEDQLFEKSVFEDVAFGPHQLGLDDATVAQRVDRALAGVGLAPERYLHRSPFALSGGEKRRVAIAGILAMEPALLILDEPTAGLDAAGRLTLMASLRKLHEERQITTVIVSHDMDLLAEVATRLVVLHEGRVVASAPPMEIFTDDAVLESTGLRPPFAVELLKALKARGVDVVVDTTRVAGAVSRIASALAGA